MPERRNQSNEPGWSTISTLPSQSTSRTRPAATASRGLAVNASVSVATAPGSG